jgi:hypothetical protein
MGRVDPEQLGDKEVELVYVAGTLAEARRVEKTLTEAGIDFTIGPEEFMQGAFSVLLASEHTGAGFFVVEGQASYCRNLLRNAGLRTGLVHEDTQ